MAWINLLKSSLAAAGLAAVLGTAAEAATVKPQGLALGDNGQTLVTLSSLKNPASATGIALLGPGGVNSLDALAYRPKTNELYGYNATSSTVYLVNAASGELTALATSSTPINVAEVGFDFNNLIDAARLVSTADNNQVFFPNNAPPNVIVATNLFYGPGDVNAGLNPSVFANAYTNQVPMPASTLQYVLDSETDSLATLANNTGVLTTIGRISLDGALLDFNATGGFDIYSVTDGDNTAYALLTTSAGQGIYRLNLGLSDGTVAATYLGAATAAFGLLDSLAVVPAAVPLPAGVLLLGSALAGLAVIRRRRRQTA